MNAIKLLSGITIFSLLVSGLLPGCLAIPRMWITNPNVIISDAPVIGFYKVKMRDLYEGETIDLKRPPANNTVYCISKLTKDSFGYLTADIINNNKMKVFCNDKEANHYSNDTDYRNSSVFESECFLFSSCHAKIDNLRKGNNKIVIISGNAMKTFYLNIK